MPHVTRRLPRSVLARLAWLALAAAGAAACTSFGSSTSSGASDAGAGACSPLWPRLDPNRGCLLPPAVAEGLCVNDATNVQAQYVLCAVSPDGLIFVKTVTGEATLGGVGWTFAPDNVIVVRQGLPRATGAAARECEVALGDAGPQGPATCGD
ncbi:hypothetical protein BH11MYX4_BH11MYX4_50410 [soil metagenome]